MIPLDPLLSTLLLVLSTVAASEHAAMGGEQADYRLQLSFWSKNMRCRLCRIGVPPRMRMNKVLYTAVISVPGGTVQSLAGRGTTERNACRQYLWVTLSGDFNNKGGSWEVRLAHL